MAPLAYILRESEEVTAAALAADYPNSDAELQATLLLTTTQARLDNQRVFDLLKPKVEGGPLWTYIRNFNRTRDGRGAYLAIKNQAEGGAAVEQRKRRAYKAIRDVYYTGKGSFTIDQYITVFQKNYAILEELDEPVPETKKVTDFLNGLKTDELKVAKYTVIGDREKSANFDLCQQYVKSCVLGIEMLPPEHRGPGNLRTRGVGAAGQGPPRGNGGKRGNGGGRKRIEPNHAEGSEIIREAKKRAADKGNGNTIDHIPRNKWFKLTDSQKAYVTEERKKDAARKASGTGQGGGAGQGGAEVSSVSSASNSGKPPVAAADEGKAKAQFAPQPPKRPQSAWGAAKPASASFGKPSSWTPPASQTEQKKEGGESKTE